MDPHLVPRFTSRQISGKAFEGKTARYFPRDFSAVTGLEAGSLVLIAGQAIGPKPKTIEDETRMVDVHSSSGKKFTVMALDLSPVNPVEDVRRRLEAAYNAVGRHWYNG